MIVMLAFTCGAAAPAGAIEIGTGAAAAQPHPDLSPVPAQAVIPYWGTPELPEPEVVAMMLVGLVLIQGKPRQRRKIQIAVVDADDHGY